MVSGKEIIKEIEDKEYIKRVYNSFILTVVIYLVSILSLILSIQNNLLILKILFTIILIILSVPLIGGINIIYENYKNEKEKKL